MIEAFRVRVLPHSLSPLGPGPHACRVLGDRIVLDDHEWVGLQAVRRLPDRVQGPGQRLRILPVDDLVELEFEDPPVR